MKTVFVTRFTLPLWLLMVAVFSPAVQADDLVVSVMPVDRLYARQQFNFTGLVAYRTTFQVITPVDGVVIQANVRVGEQVAVNALLYRLTRNEVGFSDVKIINKHGAHRVVNTFVENGQFVEANQVIMQMANPNDLKATFRVTADEARLLRGKRKFSIELFPDTHNSLVVQSYEMLFQSPTNGSPFYLVEALFKCETKRCLATNLVGAPARIKGSFEDKSVVRLPVKNLIDGMSRIYVLDTKGAVQKHAVEVINAFEEFASIRNTLVAGERIVVDTNRMPSTNEMPVKINYSN